MKKKTNLILILISLLIFITFAILIKTNNISYFDNTIYNLVTTYKNDYITIFFKTITFFCSSYFLISIIIISLLTLKRDKIGIKITINIIICVLINTLLKNVFKRPRPIGIHLINENGYSFPSGHSMASLSCYGFFIHLINKKDISKFKKILLTIILSLIIILIGISRIYLGVHYASDVMAGFALSFAHLMTYLLYYKKIG